MHELIMSGMNVIFHLGSALTAAILIWLALRLRGERDLLRALLAAGQRAEARPTGGTRVVVDVPARWLGAATAALAVAVDGEGAGGVPVRIDPGPVVDLFSSRGLRLVRWTAPDAIEMHVRIAHGDAEDTAQATRLAAALGGGVSVRIVTEKERSV